MVYYLHMKTLTTFFLVSALSACISIPSNEMLLDRLKYIKNLPCTELSEKIVEFEVLSENDLFARKSRDMANKEFNRRCKK